MGIPLAGRATFFRFTAIAAGAMAGLLAFVLGVLWAANDFDGLGLSAAGLVGWILGSIGTAAVGIVLMGLVFLSHRSGADENAHETTLTGAADIAAPAPTETGGRARGAIDQPKSPAKESLR
jgi:hypothetical protein